MGKSNQSYQNDRSNSPQFNKDLQSSEILHRLFSNHLKLSINEPSKKD